MSTLTSPYYNNDIPAINYTWTGPLKYTDPTSTSYHGIMYQNRTIDYNYINRPGYPGIGSTSTNKDGIACTDPITVPCINGNTKDSNLTECCYAPEGICQPNTIKIWNDRYGYCKNVSQWFWLRDLCSNRNTVYCATPDISNSIRLGDVGYGKCIGNNIDSCKINISDATTTDSQSFSYGSTNPGDQWPIKWSYEKVPHLIDPTAQPPWPAPQPQPPLTNKIDATAQVQYTPLLLNPSNTLIPIFDTLNLIAPGSKNNKKNGTLMCQDLYNYLASITLLPIADTKYLLLTSYIHAITTSFFTDIYAIDPDNTSPFNFLNTNNDYLKCIDANVYFHGTGGTQTIYTLLSQAFGDTTYVDKLQSQLPTYLNLPVPSGTNGYTLDFTVSYQSIMSLGIAPVVSSKRSTQDDLKKLLPILANNLMSSMLQDNKGFINKNQGIFPTFKITQPILWILVYDYSSYKLYDWQDYTTTFTSTQFIVAAKFTAQVETWSPMLFIYFSSVFNQSISADICSLSKPIPLACGNIPGIDMKKFAVDNCGYDYKIPPRFKGGQMCQISAPEVHPSDYLTLSNASGCKCINNGILPAGISQPINAGLCFSNTCYPIDRTNFGITDPDCKQYCDNIYAWTNNLPPLPTSVRPGNISTERLSTICGQNYTPYKVSQINTTVLVTGIIVTILYILGVFMHNKAKNNSPTKTIIWCLITCIILGSITIYLCQDLAGESWCFQKPDGLKSLCETKFSGKDLTKLLRRNKDTNPVHIYVSDQFCNYKQTCECLQASDCGEGDCKCINSICISSSGDERKKESITIHSVNITYAVAAVLIAIILPFIIVNLSKILKWNISQGILIVCSILLPILPFIIRYAIPQKKDIYVKDCTPTTKYYDCDSSDPTNPPVCQENPSGTNNPDDPNCGDKCTPL